MRCFAPVAAEYMRLTLRESSLSKVLTITLDAVATGKSRERASARYVVTVAMAWGSANWAAGVVLVDSRGYPVRWSFEDVGRWLVKSLPGVRCVVNLSIPRGDAVPIKWTTGRVAAARSKVVGVSAAAVVAGADDKQATVTAWAASDRKTAVLEAAAAMREAAALLLSVQGLYSAVEPPVTDPPVTDPPVTDPPVTDPPVTDPPVTALASIIQSPLFQSGSGGLDWYIFALEAAGNDDWFLSNQFRGRPVVVPHEYGGCEFVRGGLNLLVPGHPALQLRILENQSGNMVAPAVTGIFCGLAGPGGTGKAAYLIYSANGGTLEVYLYWSEGKATVIVDNLGSAWIEVGIVGQVPAARLWQTSVRGWHYGAAALNADGVML